MKLATFNPPGGDAGPLAGVLEGDQLRAFATGVEAVRDVLAGHLVPDQDLGRYPLDEVELLAPIPTPGTIFAIGLNYGDHVAEMGNTIPEWPTVFVKLNTSASPPGASIRCPSVIRRLDYEAELVLVIGQGGRVGGYCVADDVSSRDLQKREPQWIRAKGADTFCPYGPWITTADEVADVENLRIRSWVNGEPRQDSNTNQLVFGPEALIEFLSETCTLRPGDLILTGTPGGVGQGMTPPRFLQSGDRIRIEIESLGAIEHSVA